MTARDAFKAGFMQACGEMGLTGPEVAELTKKAALLLEKRAFLDQTMSNLTDMATNLGTGAAIGLPTLAGAGLGYLAHRMQSNPVDPEDVKKRELIDELRMYARRAKESQRNRQLR